MLISDEFDERRIAHMEHALELACRMWPDAFVGHGARKYVAAKILECAKDRSKTVDDFITAAKQAVAEMASKEVA